MSTIKSLVDLKILFQISDSIDICEEMESRDSWASLNQSDASLQLSKESLSTSESQPVDVDLLVDDLALSSEESDVDSDSNSGESEGDEEQGEVDKNMEDLNRRIKVLGAKLDEPLKQGWRRECLMDGEKVTMR